ncbi:hypothetical protein TrVE_jg13725 [Triparma verrucosa]|uniref:protein xylosyltransferase n=1 Tax=Triparma verrucosa TaxID=1606542 RepID=A0A9W7ERJ7_9STRA|nr:hypothetical protein TrVE_jg13725 [Triparma verrucosa]
MRSHRAIVVLIVALLTISSVAAFWKTRENPKEATAAAEAVQDAVDEALKSATFKTTKPEATKITTTTTPKTEPKTSKDYRRLAKETKNVKDKMSNDRDKKKKGNYTQTDEQVAARVEIPLGVVKSADAEVTSRDAFKLMSESLVNRMETLFSNTKTAECRQKIAEAMSEYVNAIGGETALPWTQHNFKSECPRKSKDHSNADASKELPKPEDLKILYLVMTHDKPEQTIRLISKLEDVGHTFVIHVDAKPSSDSTQTALKEHYADHPLVHVLPQAYRVSVSWGAFGVVESTLSAIKYAFGYGRPGPSFDFNKVVNVASTSYPMKSNQAIREEIARHSLDSSYMEIRPSPNRPSVNSWHYYLECDDVVHRIYRLAKPTGIEMYVGSQWFMISREFAEMLVDGSSRFVQEYLDYGSHVVVADENFFATVMKNSRLCGKHVNKNHLHVQFDDWENNRKKEGERDPSKCLQPNPNHCGRSPTTMTVDYIPVLELSDALFARKFNYDVDSEILDMIDRKRAEGYKDPVHLFDGGDVLIVMKESLGDVPMCLTRAKDGKKIRVTRCFNEGKEKEAGWGKTSVQLSDVPEPLKRWSVGPCSTDGNITLIPGECVETTKEGTSSGIGPTCRIQGANGHAHKSKCLDVEGERMTPGGDFLMYSCTGRWNQYFSFGTPSTRDCSIHLNVPSHLIKTKSDMDIVQPAHLCVNGGHDSTRVKTVNCVEGDVASKVEVKPDWYEKGNDWLIVMVEGTSPNKAGHGEEL